MKIGIHKQDGSLSDDWIAYCEQNNIAYKVVSCYSSSIIKDLADCDALMWHWRHTDPKAILFARQLALSLEKMGIPMFPNVATSWHFDDKVGQKYLFEAVEAPLIPSYIFYDKKTALEWVGQTVFPKVFKLRGGSSAVNVKLARTAGDAVKLINKAFGSGFSPKNRRAILGDRYRTLKRKREKKSLINFFRGIARAIVPTEFEKMHGPEKGYAYFQDFIPGNKYDTRVVVIGDKCFGIIRYNRENDFRASGSGMKDYNHELFDKRCLKEAFETTEKLGAQCLAYDFVIDEHNKPLIVEISYCFTTSVFPGYWDRDFNWHDGKINVRRLMAENFISTVRNKVK